MILLVNGVPYQVLLFVAPVVVAAVVWVNMYVFKLWQGLLCCGLVVTCHRMRVLYLRWFIHVIEKKFFLTKAWHHSSKPRWSRMHGEAGWETRLNITPADACQHSQSGQQQVNIEAALVTHHYLPEAVFCTNSEMVFIEQLGIDSMYLYSRDQINVAFLG